MFDDIKLLKEALRTMQGAYKAQYRFARNNKYITAHCRVYGCHSLLTFKIENLVG